MIQKRDKILKNNRFLSLFWHSENCGKWYRNHQINKSPLSDIIREIAESIDVFAIFRLITETLQGQKHFFRWFI